MGPINESGQSKLSVLIGPGKIKIQKLQFIGNCNLIVVQKIVLFLKRFGTNMKDGFTYGLTQCFGFTS
jgi:hypothetical protein